MSAAFPPSWYAASLPEPPALPSLQGNVQADVAVLGAGYTGLTAALELATRGQRVVVLVDAAEGPMPQTKFVTGKALALGSLELILQSSYATADPYIGDAIDVEAVAEWQGETATLEPAPDRPHNVTHDDITPHPAARGVLQPVQL